MFLSNQNINWLLKHGELKVAPLGEGAVQPASIDVRLGNRLLVHTGSEPLDPACDNKGQFEERHLADGIPFMFEPGMFALGGTLEVVSIPNFLICRIEGVSTNGRTGLNIHATAGWVDPGFEGPLTLELSNATRVPIPLTKGMRIGQLAFARLASPANPVYKGRYKHQPDVQAGIPQAVNI